MCRSTRKWLRAFTQKETIYTIVEAVLLLILILFLVYLILHLSVCSASQKRHEVIKGRSRSNNTEPLQKIVDGRELLNISSQRRVNTEDSNNDTSIVTDDRTETAGAGDKDNRSNIKGQGIVNVKDMIINISNVTNRTTASAIEGSNFNTTESRSANVVRPVKRARSVTVWSADSSESGAQEQNTNGTSEAEEIAFYVDYYEDEPGPNNTMPTKVKHCKKCEEARREHQRGKCDCGACASNRTVRHGARAGTLTLNVNVTVNVTRPGAVTSPLSVTSAVTSPVTGVVMSHVPGVPTQRITITDSKLSDSAAASELHKSLVVALVRAEADDTFTSVCVAVVLRARWALAAAACIPELHADSLGRYLLVQRLGEGAESLGEGAESLGEGAESLGVREAAREAGGEVLALRVAGSLLARGGRPARLASPLDHLLLVLGETFTALGYGNFRSIQARNEDLRLRQTCINWVLEAACGGGAARDAARDGEARDGAARDGVCGGVLYGSAAPCYYCVGTPLFRGDVLYALAAGGTGGRGEGACGGACPPRRYVRTRGLRDWLDDVLRSERSEPAATEPDYYHNDEY